MIPARSRAPRAARALAVALAVAAPRTAGASARADRAWWVPDHAKVQLAGDIGFVSPGVGWELAGRRLELDAFAGWVPASVGGRDLFSATAKLGFTPWRVAVRRVRLQPITAALQVTYTFGSAFFVTSPDTHPPGYYELPTAVHADLAIGAAVARTLRGERELGVSVEVVGRDHDVRDWLDNRRALSAGDVLSLALGARLRF